ncbi:MAG: hypothetical protein NT166_10865 [Candidatus Aminicenantes bacterium]|nr:hypothetical protein [Candidatus Aminicenantes bacterium]
MKWLLALITWLKKLWPLLLVAALVLVGWFYGKQFLSSSQYKLEPTFISVSSIRDMGRLITAEYYGEVVHSLNDQYYYEIKETWNRCSINKNGELDDEDSSRLHIFFSMEYIIRIIKDFDDLAKKTDIKSYYDKILKEKARWAEGNKEIIKKDIQRILITDSLFDKIKNKADNLFNEDLKKDTDFFEKIEKVVDNTQIAYLARGWIKAGVDLFKDFEDGNFCKIKDAWNRWKSEPEGSFSLNEQLRLLTLLSVESIAEIINNSSKNSFYTDYVANIDNLKNESSDKIKEGLSQIRDDATLYQSIALEANKLFDNNDRQHLISAINKYLQTRMDEEFFYFCPTHNTLYVQAEVSVLNNDINPWFICSPSFNIPGYTILEVKDVKITDQDDLERIKHVKNGCNQKLEREALGMGILVQAKESAEEIFTRFFTMIPIKDTNFKDQNLKIDAVIIAPLTESLSELRNKCKCRDDKWKTDLNEKLKMKEVPWKQL